jgi:putative (di)nucleoside polyphosphate hydrolase
MSSSGSAHPDSTTDRSRDGGDQSGLPFREPRWLSSLFGDRRGEQSQRLASEMAKTWYRAGGGKDGEYGEANCPRAIELIKAAATELGDRRREAAWALSQAAHRELIRVMDPAERKAMAGSVREEADKLSGWRRRRVEQLTSGDERVPSAAELVEAFQHIDESNSNRMRSQRILRRELAILGVILVVAAAALAALLVAWLPAPQPEPPPGAAAASSPLAGLASDRLAVLAVLFGVLGACISSIQRATSRRPMRVPDLRSAMWAGLTRPVVGAAAGLVVWALAVEGVLGNQGLGVLGFAFAAGFSERVILRFIPDGSDSLPESEKSSSERTLRVPLGAKAPRWTRFRANVGLAVLDPAGKVLLLRRADHPEAWQLPQGGLEPGETPAAAAWRELAEETRLSAADVALEMVMDHWLGYELPERMRSGKTGRGQVQLWHVFRLTRHDVEVEPGTESIESRWADWDDAIANAVAFRQPIYRQVRDFVRQSSR